MARKLEQTTATTGAETEQAQPTVALPVMSKPKGYCPRAFEIGSLSQLQSEAMASLREALNASHCQLLNGKHVDTNADAMRWLLERVAATFRG